MPNTEMTDTDKVVLEVVRLHADLVVACADKLRNRERTRKSDQEMFVDVLRTIGAIYANTIPSKLLDPFDGTDIEGKPNNYHGIMASAFASMHCRATDAG